MEPLRPAHKDKIVPIPYADVRLQLRRRLVGYAYPANGNLHNPTPRYMWDLLADGKVVDTATKAGTLKQAATSNGSDYLEEIDTNTEPRN